MDPELARRLSNVRWQDESTVAFSRHLDLDIMDYLNPPIRTTRKHVTLESVVDGRDVRNIWHTPKGDLQEVVRRSEDGNTSYRVKHQVERPEDLGILAFIFDDECVELDPAGVGNVALRSELVGDDGMLMLFCPGTPMGMMYRVYSGVEALVYCLADAPRAMRDLFRVMEENYQERFRLALRLRADAVVGMDDTSTTVVSPGMFEQHNLELTDERADLAHRAGKLYFHHSCGMIHDLLPLYRETRMDAVHAFTVPPTGDVTVSEGRRLLGDRITIIAGAGPMGGNMDDRNAAADAIREMYCGAEGGDHFIMNLAAYPDKTMEQTRFIVDECRKHMSPSSRLSRPQ